MSSSVLALALLGTLATPAAVQEGRGRTGFCLYADGGSQEFLEPLSEMLSDLRWQVVRATTLDQAIHKPASVLVLVLTARGSPKLTPEQVRLLRRRRVVGVGRGCAGIFHDLGLEIGEWRTASSDEDAAPAILVPGSTLVQEAVTRPFPAYDEAGERSFNQVCAVHLAPKTHLFEVVEPLAWQVVEGRQTRYAPLVRQGNFILVGFGSPPSCWSARYKHFLVDVATGLRRRKAEVFQPKVWPITRPGTYRVTLDKECPRRSFYFAFRGPTTFEAVVDHDGKGRLMVNFAGRNGERGTRKDPPPGESARIRVEITERDLEQAGDAQWKLTLANFAAAAVRCKLRIAYGNSEAHK